MSRRLTQPRRRLPPATASPLRYSFRVRRPFRLILGKAARFELTDLLHDAFADAPQAVGATRAGILSGHFPDDLVFALGLADRHAKNDFRPHDLLGDFRAAVEQRAQLKVELVDLAAALSQRLLSFFARHASIPFAFIPFRRPRAKSSICSSLAFFPIRRTRALPTTTPSAILATTPACSGVEMPNPAAKGRRVTL